MRIDLEMIKKIEAYLTGTMDPTEQKVFEQEISTNTELNNAVEQQRNLMKAMEKSFVKNAAKNAGKKVKMYSILKKGGIVVAILIVLTAAFFGYREIRKNIKESNPKQSDNIVIPDLKKGESYDPGAFIQSQYFEIDGNKDTVIVGEYGTMFAIPAGSFIDGSNNKVNGKITIELKEALDPATIMLSGLSTFSNDKPLETGGMFYINARSNGQDLRIGEGGILTSVPQTESKPGMMMFDGVVDEKGNINWVNPQQPEQYLLPVDIRALDFYPPGFVAAINGPYELQSNPVNMAPDSIGVDTLLHKDEITTGLGSDQTQRNPNAKLSKHYTDSLYLSFEGEGKKNYGLDWSEDGHTTLVDQNGNVLFDGVIKDRNDLKYLIGRMIPVQGISPSKVLAFWQSSFNQTFLATKEFESRMPLIHQTCNNAILDLYINNLDKKLYEVDSMAAQIAGGLTPEFLKFAAMKHGRIPNGDKKYDLLQKFYQRQAFVMAQAAIVTTKTFYAKNQRAELEAIRRGNNFSSSEMQRTTKLFDEEYNLNLRKACKDLGYPVPNNKPRPINLRVGAGTSWIGTVTNPGWKNIDRMVEESLIARTTLDFTDTITGRRTVIEYEEVTINVTNFNEFDMINVYLVPNRLSTYMKVNGINGKFSEKLNMNIKYDLFVVGYKNKQVYFQSVHRPSNYPCTLSDKDIMRIEDLMVKLGSKQNTESLKMAVNYSMFKIADEERRMKYDRIMADRDRLRPIVFPCSGVKNDTLAKDSTRTVAVH